MHPKYQNPGLISQIRDSRKNLGINQTDLAEAVGVKQSAVSMLERGKWDAISDEKFEKILLKLKINPELFIETLPHNVIGYCVDFHCPGLRLRLFQHKLIAVPYMVEQSQHSDNRCLCGHSLAFVCKTEGCNGSPSSLSSPLCPVCQSPWVNIDEIDDPPFTSLKDSFSQLKNLRPSELVFELSSLKELVKEFNEDREIVFPVDLQGGVLRDRLKASVSSPASN